MNALLITLRLLHIVTASLWVGFGAFSALMLGPALGDVGPDAGKVMGALQRRGLSTVIPAIALVTIISGFWLYWLVSGGLLNTFVSSRTGILFGAGGVIALAAYLLGLIVIRPMTMKVAALMQSIPGVTNPDQRNQLIGEAKLLKARSDIAAKAGAALLLLAAASMAVARYL